MKPVRSPHLEVSSAAAPNGTTGFDASTGGGLPCGHTRLLAGGSSADNTIFALQFLMHGARTCKKSGIFVAFEEPSKRVMIDAGSFGWKRTELRQKELFYQPLLVLQAFGLKALAV